MIGAIEQDSGAARDHDRQDHADGNQHAAGPVRVEAGELLVGKRRQLDDVAEFRRRRDILERQLVLEGLVIGFGERRPVVK